MSLREFIRATAEDVQAALKTAQEKNAEPGATAAGGASKNKEVEKPGMKKKEKRGNQLSEEEDKTQKRRRKERAQKTMHEEQREKTPVVAQRSPSQSERETHEAENELPATPSAGRGFTTAIPYVDIEEGEEIADRAGMSENRAGTSTGSAMYQPQWPNIGEETMLNSPLLRAEWVARSLPPSEVKAYARADTFDVCDIANRAAILSTIVAYGMQQLLCAKDKQITDTEQEYARVWTAYEKADGLVSAALRREKDTEKELERLRAEVGEVPLLKTQLAEAQATAAQMRAEVEQLTAQGVEKDKEIEKLHADALRNAQDLAAATGNLAGERHTRHYLMTSGIAEILAKVRISHEYGKFVGGLVPKLQVLGKAELIKKMRHDYFPDVRPEDIPYFVPNAEAEAEEAFQRLRTEPFECHILNQLAANPDMTEEEIRNLKNPDLLKKEKSKPVVRDEGALEG